MDKARLLVAATLTAGTVLIGACGSSKDTANSGGGGASTAPSGGTSSNEGGSANAGGNGPGGSSGTAGGGTGGGVVQSGLTKVGTGEYEVFFLIDGVIYGYGASDGTLGMGSYQGISIPARPIATPAGVKFIDVQGGLHQSMALDENHKVWTWGATDSGFSGDGTIGGDATTPLQITEDAAGKPFDHVVLIEPATHFNSALKDDGTVWAWGDCTGLMPGPDKENFITKPTQVKLPDGLKIKRMIAGAASLLAVATDGTVWAWGTSEAGMYLGTGAPDSITPTQIKGLPSNIKDVAAGYSSFFYALTDDGELWGWGFRWLYLGMQDPAHDYWPQAKPVALKKYLNLPKAVKSISCDQISTHVISEDDTLWGWGDDAQGEVGDGQELDYSKMNCAWDYATNLWVYHPLQIIKDQKFKSIFSNSAYDFYTYALTLDGKLYAWGRNKTAVIANGVYGQAADGNMFGPITADYPNSWDVVTPTLVDPLHVTPKPMNSPCCVANPDKEDCK